MLDQGIIASESKRIGISPDRIAREAWEVLVLDQLYQEGWSKRLVFKGGTALRLAWDCPRYSDDLDFSLAASIDFALIESWCKKLTRVFRSELDVQDVTNKQFTAFALIRIQESFLPKPFTIKLEVSNRLPFQKKTEYELKLVQSNLIPQQVLLPVLTLEALWNDKLITFKSRGEPRDLFDLWYLAQKLKRPFPKLALNRDPMDVKQDLNKFLPLSFRPVVLEIVRLCKPSSKH